MELTERQKQEILDLVRTDEDIERLVHRVGTLEAICEGFEKRLKDLERAGAKRR